MADALEICAGWGLTPAETEALVAGDPIRAAAVLRIAYLLDGLYSGSLPRLWMTLENRNPRLGGSVEIPVRPVDHVLESEDGIWDVLRLLEGHAQGP